MKETELFFPIKKYLEGQGYSVSGEVRDCDIVARKGEEICIIETKTRLSVSLLLQASKRKTLCDSVYVALPMPEGRTRFPKEAEVKLLLRRIGVGLIVIRFLKGKIVLQVLLHPSEFSERRAVKKKAALIREIDSRYAELDMGGSPAAGAKLTAYRQESLRIAALLKDRSLSPKELRGLGTGEKTQRILSGNVYGWFNKESRGLYSLSDAGIKALINHSGALEVILKAAEGGRRS